MDIASVYSTPNLLRLDRTALHLAASRQPSCRQPVQSRPRAGTQNGANQPQHVGMVPEDRRVREVRLDQIRRPLRRTRANDPDKVRRLAESIAEIGLQEPIDVLDVDGQLYGFSGCHRYEAHQVLGRETILCRIRKGSKATLRMHMM